MTKIFLPKPVAASASAFPDCTLSAALLKISLSMVLTILLVVSATSAIAKAPAKSSSKNTVEHMIKPPPSADLSYTIKAKQKGLSLTGDASVQWRASKDQYSMTSETRAMLLGKILDTTSEGSIDAYGLAPSKATEKRFRKKPTNITFDRNAKRISFSASDAEYPIKGGEQDRNSAIWQLATLARSNPNKFKSGALIPMFIAGQKDADAWKFKVEKSVKIETKIGNLNAIHLSKIVKNKSEDQQIDIWFAPSLDWYPIRLRFTEPDGDYIEQTIDKITPQN